MHRPVLALTALLFIACATTETPGTAPAGVQKTPPAATAPEVAPPAASSPLKDGFYFVHCLDQQSWVLLDNDAHLSLEEQLLTLAAGELSAMAGSTEGFVVAQALTDEGRTLLGDSVVGKRFNLYNQADKVATGTLGEPKLVGRVVPHSEMMTEWSEDGIAPGGEKDEISLKDLRGIASMHLMAPLDVSCKEDVFYWARPEALAEPSVVAFREVDAGAEADWSRRTLGAEGWRVPSERVAAAYTQNGESLPPVDVQVFTTNGSGAFKPCSEGCYHVQLHLGTVMCGMGPDEALLSAFWGRQSKALEVVEERHSPLVPVLMGDFDGDGLAEVVGKSDSLSQTVELFRFVDGKLVPVKATSITYADCPC